jgi:hypothetical protein
LLVRSWIEGLFLGDSTSGGGLKDKGKGRHEQWLHSNPDSKIGGGALNRLRYDHLPVYRSIGEMSVPTQRIVSPLGVADCDSLASMTFLCPGLPVKAIRTAATRYCGKTVTASSADGGAWAMTALERRAGRSACRCAPVSLNPRSAAHAYELNDALDGLWAVRPLETLWLSALSGAIERVDQISTNGRLWVGANEPRSRRPVHAPAKRNS